MTSTRTRTRGAAALAVTALVMVLAAPAAAHHIFVNPPGQDETIRQPVGGGPLPPSASGKGLHVGGPPFAPFFMAAAHSAGPEGDKGLVQACSAPGRENSAVTFAAPPNFTTCVHGNP